MHKTDDIQAWRIFCEVVRAEGLNAACDNMGIEPSTASRAVKGLETELGLQLFLRAGRAVRLTGAGREAYRRALALLSLHQEMLDDLCGDRERMAGMIHVASYAAIGPLEVTPALVEFQQIYPDIHFELRELSQRLPDGFLFPDGSLMDVVIGYGETDSMPGVVKRYSGEMPFVPCAAPLYVRRNGIPREPEDTARHTGLLVNSPTRTASATLEKDGQTAELHWKRTLTMQNLIAVKSALLLGAGVVPDMPLYHCADSLEQGTLVPVLEGWHRRPLSCFIYVREEAYRKHRVQVFADWMAEREKQSMERLRQRFPQFYRN